MRVGVGQTDSSCSMAASSLGRALDFGPVNHLRAETSQEMPANPITTTTAIGA